MFGGAQVQIARKLEDIMVELIEYFFGNECVVLVSYSLTLHRKQELWTETKRKNVWRKHDSKTRVIG